VSFLFFSGRSPLSTVAFAFPFPGTKWFPASSFPSPPPVSPNGRNQRSAPLGLCTTSSVHRFCGCKRISAFAVIKPPSRTDPVCFRHPFFFSLRFPSWSTVRSDKINTPAFTLSRPPVLVSSAKGPLSFLYLPRLLFPRYIEPVIDMAKDISPIFLA